MASTVTTRIDAIVGVAEDVVLTGGAGLGAWLSTHSFADVVTAAGATQGGKSALALLLSGGRSGRIAKALKLIGQVLNQLNQVDAAAEGAKPPASPAHSL